MNGTARAPVPSARPEARQGSRDAPRRCFVGLKVHELDQVAHRHRARRRLGAVIVFLEAQQHRRIAPGGVEPAGAGSRPRTADPAPPASRAPRRATPRRRSPAAARAGPRREAGVVLAVALDAGLAVAPAAQQRLRRGLPQRGADEARGPRRAADPARTALGIGRREHAAGAGRRGNHQPVPRGEHLVVERRTRTTAARLEEDRPRPRDDVDDLVDRSADAHGDVLEAGRGVEQVLAGELLLRIERGVAGRLEAEAEPDDLARRPAPSRASTSACGHR